MTMEGHGRGTDEDLEKATTVAVKSQPACLSRLARGGYLLPSRRKNSGQRDTTLAAQFLPALRRHGRFRQEEQAEWAGGSRADSATQRNSPPSQEENPNKKTPNSEESLTYAHEAREARREETQGGSESLDCDSSSSVRRSEFLDDVLRAGEHSLADLAERYGVGHFALDVIQAAACFDDVPGCCHYNMVYTTMASSDQDVWAKAVSSVLTRWRAGEIASPRPYMATTVQGILAERSKVLTEREQLAAMGLFRTATVAAPAPPDDTEFDALILLDPFAADIEGDGAGAGADDAAWEQPEELTPDQPAPAPAAAPAPAPSVVRPRPFAAKKPVPAPAQGDPAVLADAARRLGLDTEANNLGSLYSGVCKGRLEVFLLAVRMAELSEASSPTSFVAKVAAENVGKDAQWLRDRTDGLTAADCTAELKKFEAELEAEKQRLNTPMTRMGGFRNDAPAGIGAVIDTLPFDTGTPQDGGLALPTTPRGWADLQAKMTAMRGKYDALSSEDQKECNDAGTALACSKVQRNHMTWDDWRKLGTYHAVCALVDARTRAANVQASREMVAEKAPLG